MSHKRIHVRVPISGEVLLTTTQGIRTQTSARDISPGGVGVGTPTTPLEQTEYQIEICTKNGKNIQLTATLAHEGKHSSGFVTSNIDEKNLQIIALLVAEFQTTEEFIKQIDEHDLFEQKYIDEDGQEISVSFDKKNSDG